MDLDCYEGDAIESIFQDNVWDDFIPLEVKRFAV